MEGGSGITLTARLDKASTQKITIRSAGRSIVVPAGRTTGSTTLVATDNEWDTPDRVREVPITYDPANAVDVTRSQQRITLTLVDDDPAPKATISLRQNPAADENRIVRNVGSVLGDGASASVRRGRDVRRLGAAGPSIGQPDHRRHLGAGHGLTGPHHPARCHRTTTGAFTTYVIESGETTPEDTSSLVAVRITDDAVKKTGVRTLTITAVATNAHGVTQSAQTLTVTVTDND